MLPIWLVGILFLVSGCSSIDQGELGRKRGANGWVDKVEKPGIVGLGVFTKLYRLDATEDTYEEELEILTADNINLKCKIAMRCGVDATKEKEVLSIFDRVKADENGVIKRHDIYRVYGKMVLTSVPREILGPLTIDEIREKRQELAKQIDKAVRKELEKTPLKVTAVKITNIDWPDVITRAMEARKEREIEIEAEKAKIEKEMVAAQGRHRVAEEEYKIKILEAKMIADYNKIIADSLKKNPEFLTWHTVKVLSEAAKGPNNAFIIIPYEALIAGSTGGNITSNALLRQMLQANPLEKQKK